MERLDGAQNMAIDRAMLRRAELGEALVRVYGWSGPWVSLGRSQLASRALLAGCPAAWVRRPTGGRAVLHGHDATLAAAAPLEALGSGRRLSQVHSALLTPIKQALTACGQPVVMAAPRPPGSDGSADCFAFASSVDLVHEKTGLKVCGCALRITQGAVLLQASIPMGEPLVDAARVFLQPAAAGILEGLNPASLQSSLLSAFAFLHADLA